MRDDQAPALVTPAMQAFLSTHINPHAVRRDQEAEALPGELLAHAAKAGMLGYSLPRDIGGGGHGYLAWGRLLEELGYLSEDGSLPLWLSLRAAVIRALYDAGQPVIRERYLPALVRGQLGGSFAYTDGTDPFSFNSCARKSGEDWVLQGEKLLVTGGETADLFMTYVRAEPSGDLLVFVIERGDEGVQVRPVPVNGMRSAGLASVHLSSVRLPPERLLVDRDGLSHAQRFLNQRRPLVMCGPLGRMRAIRDSCIRCLRGTIRYGQPLTEMQNVQAGIGRMTITIETCRAILFRALQQADQGLGDPLFDLLASSAKHHITEQAIELILRATRLVGGQGYLKESSYERYLRDFTGLIPGAGAQDLLEINLGVLAIASQMPAGPPAKESR